MSETLHGNFPTASIRGLRAATTADGAPVLVLDMAPMGSIALAVDKQAIQLIRETLSEIEAALSTQ